jgi:hypothetical protein
MCLFLSVTSLIPRSAAGVPIEVGILDTWVCAYLRGPYIVADQIFPSRSAKKMSSSASETPRSLSHMIGKHDEYAAFSHSRTKKDMRRAPIVSIPLGYTLVPVQIKDPSCRGKLCPDFLETGACHHLHSGCDYSHSLEEVRSYNQHYRTKICEFAASGFCKKGKACRFAHSSEELGTQIVCETKPNKTLSRTERESSTVSTEPATPSHSASGSRGFSFEIHTNVATSPTSSRGRSQVCYQAPPEQRKLMKKNTTRRSSSVHHALVPSSFHYLDNLKYTGDDLTLPTWQNAAIPFIPMGGYHPSGMFYAAMPVMYGGRIHRSETADSGSSTPHHQYED